MKCTCVTKMEKRQKNICEYAILVTISAMAPEEYVMCVIDKAQRKGRLITY